MHSAHLRARLASFANAYAVAIRIRGETGTRQYILKTGNPLQPVKVSAQRPTADEEIMALVA